MLEPKIPQNEVQRLNAVRSYQLLDTFPEVAYDSITSLIASVCDAPVCLITLLDEERNFLKSCYGVELSESSRGISFCGHAILQPEDLFIVEDTSLDPRFSDNPIVTEMGYKSYIGAPLVNDDGFALGTLCIFDSKPRKLKEKEREIIVAMAKQVVNLFELHKKNNQLNETQKELEERNTRLKKFAGLVTHDLKSPLGNIFTLTRMLKEECMIGLSKECTTYLDYIEESSVTMRNYVSDMLDFYKSDGLLKEKETQFLLGDLFEDLEEMLFVNPSSFIYPTEAIFIHTNKQALYQILLNLITNSLKYNHHKKPTVTIQFSEEPLEYTFTVIDNGPGITEEDQVGIFDMFKTTSNTDKDGKRGSGIGLATVQNLVKKLNGTIHLASTIGKGTSITFTIKKTI